jgi:metaxin
LRFAGLKFHTVASSNHASPIGVLPFLEPGSSAADHLSPPKPVPSNQLRKWLETENSSTKLKEADDVRYDAYMALLEDRIRTAWVRLDDETYCD